jgi:hypothetical protein
MDKPKRKNKPGAGRPVVSEEDRLRTTTIRLTAKQLEQFYELGGIAWLRAKIELAQKGK